MEHIIGSETLPKEPEVATFRDSLSVNLGAVSKSYINLVLGDAWKQVNHGDGYVVKNVLIVPFVNISNIIAHQFPALFVSRNSIIRQPFTQSKDYLISTLIIDYIFPLADAIQEDKWGVLTSIPKAIESMLHRNLQVDGYGLLTYLGVENIKLKRSQSRLVAANNMSMPGYYQSYNELEVIEIVNPATEDVEDLEMMNIVMDLGNAENETTIDNFTEIEYEQ